jgi:hypothetical protein
LRLQAWHRGPDRAANILRDNHYGWFEKLEHGIYGLSEAGRREARKAA